MTKLFLLDACVPRKLAGAFKVAEIKTAHEMGWSDLDDGALLDCMGDQFEALVTVDKGIPNQQKLDHRGFSIIILRAKSNRLDDLIPLVNLLETEMETYKAGHVYEIFET